MTPGQYPRPQASSKPSVATPYDGDRTWGGVIVLFSALRLFNYGSSLGAAAGGPRVFALGMMGLLALRLVGGVGLLASRRWGLLLVAATSSAYVLIDLVSLTKGGSPLSILSLALSAYIVYYCVLRLTGKEGPPVA